MGTIASQAVDSSSAFSPQLRREGQEGKWVKGEMGKRRTENNIFLPFLPFPLFTFSPLTVASHLPLRQHHRPDHGNQQQDRGNLKRQQKIGKRSLTHRHHRAIPLRERTLTGSIWRAAQEQKQLGHQERAANRGRRAQSLALVLLRITLHVQKHNHKEEEDHDSAGVDNDLQHSDHVGIEEEKIHRQEEQSQYEEERAIHWVGVENDHGRNNNQRQRQREESNVVH